MSEYRLTRSHLVEHVTYPPDWRVINPRHAARTAFGNGLQRAAAELLEVAARRSLEEAIGLAVAASVVAVAASVVEHEGDALGDEDLMVASITEDREPREALSARLLQRLFDEITAARLRVRSDLVVDAVVGDLGHDDSPAVGPVAGSTAPVGGAAALDTPAAGVPTVGLRADVPADVPPSAGASARDLAGDIQWLVSRDVMDIPRLAERLYGLGWRR